MSLLGLRGATITLALLRRVDGTRPRGLLISDTGTVATAGRPPVHPGDAGNIIGSEYFKSSATGLQRNSPGLRHIHPKLMFTGVLSRTDNT